MGVTLEQLSHLWSRDERYVYCLGNRIRVNRQTFRVLNEIFATDGEHIYYINGKVTGVDVATFEVLDAGFYSAPDAWDKRPVYHGYARDKDNVYFQDMMFGKPRPIKGADPKTFVRLEWDYAADAKSVYCEGRRLHSCDPKTLKVLSNLFAKDQRRCYYLNRVIAGADPETFELYPPLTENDVRFFAFDRQCVYYQDWRLLGSDPSSFQLTDDGYGKDRTGLWDAKRMEPFNPHLRREPDGLPDT